MPLEESKPAPSGFPQKLKKGLQTAASQLQSKVCSKKFMHQRIPITDWIWSYNLNKLFVDAVTGVTCALTVIPQSIAIANVAGIPVQYGLYSSFMAPFVYLFLGSVKQISVGPTAILGLLTYTYAHSGGVEYAILLSFVAGCIELGAGIINLGFLVDYISGPVISGFASAAAITIATSMLKGLLGLKFEGSSFVKVWVGIFSNLSKIKGPDAGLGFSCIVMFVVMKRKLSLLADLNCSTRIFGSKIFWFKKTLWFISTTINAVAVIVGCVVTYFLKLSGYEPFTLTGTIKSGVPSFDWPHFSITKTTGNVTEVIGFGEISGEIGTAYAMVPIIGILGQIAVAKAFTGGRKTDATQEMIALGVCTIVGSFFGAMPVQASFGRSAVQNNCGIESMMANVFVGGLVLLALAFLMPSLAYIPKAVLSAVIISSVIFMIDYHEIKPMWKSRRLDLIPFTITFLCCLFISIQYGILIGIEIHLFLLAYQSNRSMPKINRTHNEDNTEEQIVIKVNSNLYYPGVAKFRRVLNKAILSLEPSKAGAPSASITVDMTNVFDIDYTALKMLQSVTTDLRKRSVVLQFLNAKGSVEKSLKAALPAKDIAFLPKEEPNDIVVCQL